MASDQAVGFIACMVSSVLFGSMFLTIKKFDIGNGMYMQFIQSLGILIVGLIINVIRNNPQFYLMAALSGVIWSIGNIFCVPVLQCLGMGIGMPIWTTMQTVIGWASGRFGWFGLKAEKPASDALNYSGIVISILGGIIFAFVESGTGKENRAEQATHNGVDSKAKLSEIKDEEAAVKSVNGNVVPEATQTPEDEELNFFEKLTPWKRRLLGLTMAVIAGLFFGTTFNPVIYIQEEYDGASQNGLDYVFAAYSGTFFMSTFYMLVYAAYTRNQPDAQPELIIPSFAYGVVWSIAQSCFFIANAKLSEAVSTPIIGRLPALISSAWGVFLYKEVTGKKNLILLACATVVTIVGSVLTGLSKSL